MPLSLWKKTRRASLVDWALPSAVVGSTISCLFSNVGKILWSGEDCGQHIGMTVFALHSTGIERAMVDLERTTAGWQFVIDGCEIRTLPRSTRPVDDCGQGLLGFYQPPSDSELMQHKIALPLRGKRAQRPLPRGGLFSH